MVPWSRGPADIWQEVAYPQYIAYLKALYLPAYEMFGDIFLVNAKAVPLACLSSVNFNVIFPISHQRARDFRFHFHFRSLSLGNRSNTLRI